MRAMSRINRQRGGSNQTVLSACMEPTGSRIDRFFEVIELIEMGRCNAGHGFFPSVSHSQSRPGPHEASARRVPRQQLELPGSGQLSAEQLQLNPPTPETPPPPAFLAGADCRKPGGRW